MKLTVPILALLVGAFVLPCGAQNGLQSPGFAAAPGPSPPPGAILQDDYQGASPGFASAPGPSPPPGAVLPSATTLAPGTTAGTTTTNSSSGVKSPSVTEAPTTVTTKAPAPAGTKVPQVLSTFTLQNYFVDTFTTSVQQTFINALRSALPPSANVLVAITRFTSGSVNVESSVTFLDGDNSAAAAFASALAAPSSTIFSSAGLGPATLVPGSVTTQAVVASAPAPSPSSASTTSIAMLALTGAVGAFCLAVVSL